MHRSCRTPVRRSYTRSMTDIAACARATSGRELDEAASAADPMQQFERWLEQAIAAQAAGAERDDAGDRRRRRPAVDAHRADQGLRCARHRLVHATTRAARAANSPPIRTPRCSSTGSSSSAWCASKARSRRVERAESDAYFAVAAARFAHRRLGVAAERGDRVARGAGRQRGAATAPSSCSSRRGRRTGAAIACCPTPGSSGRAASRRLHDRLRYRRDGDRLAARAAGALAISAPRRAHGSPDQ